MVSLKSSHLDRTGSHCPVGAKTKLTQVIGLEGWVKRTSFQLLSEIEFHGWIALSMCQWMHEMWVYYLILHGWNESFFIFLKIQVLALMVPWRTFNIHETFPLHNKEMYNRKSFFRLVKSWVFSFQESAVRWMHVQAGVFLVCVRTEAGVWTCWSEDSCASVLTMSMRSPTARWPHAASLASPSSPSEAWGRDSTSPSPLRK